MRNRCAFDGGRLHMLMERLDGTPAPREKHMDRGAAESMCSERCVAVLCGGALSRRQSHSVDG